MTIGEKAKKLQKYCDKHNSCKNCVLNSYNCGLFASWLDRTNLISDNDVEEAYNTVFGKEDENMFTKKDLEDGMLVKIRSGSYFLVCGEILIGESSYLKLQGYTDDCRNLFEMKDLDIIEVFEKITALDCLKYEWKRISKWKRPEPKENEIEKVNNSCGCKGCAFEDTEEWEMPCCKCSRGCKDYWRLKPKKAEVVVISKPKESE